MFVKKCILFRFIGLRMRSRPTRAELSIYRKGLDIYFHGAMKVPARANSNSCFPLGAEETSVKRTTLISSYIVIALLILWNALPAFSATEKVLHAFSAFPHGDFPAGLVADSRGILYGTARGGS